MPPGKVFIPRHTTQLLPGGLENIYVILIAKSLEHEKKNINGIQPCFGGKVSTSAGKMKVALLKQSRLA